MAWGPSDRNRSSRPQPTALFRRQTFLDIGGLREELDFAMDLDLWLRLLGGAAPGEAVFVDRVVAHARMHGQAKTRAMIAQTLREIDQVKAEHRPNLRLTLMQRIRHRLGRLMDAAYQRVVALGLHRPPA